MKHLRKTAWALTALIVGVWTLASLGTAGADDNGWLEAKVHDAAGTPTHAMVDLLDTSGSRVAAGSTDANLVETAVIRDIRPGLYEIRVTYPGLRPLRIWGVPINAGVRSFLDVTVHKGSEPEEIGKPPVPTQSVVSITAELERLRAAIEELKKQIAALQPK